MSEDNVQVAVRIRPLGQSEIERGCQAVVERVPNSQQVVVNRNDTFTYNYVFGVEATQTSVYEKTVSPMLDKLLSGFNATILAYGQTGSGKTHTMGTAYDGQLTEEVGIIPRAMRDIFERMEKLAGEFEFLLSCSFMELYQEQLYDLLSLKGREESTVELRENKAGNIIIPDLTEAPVRTASETFECLVRGSSGRAVASTSMNQQSSRSHAIFTLTIEATKKADANNVTTSKFHLVDLAGSERSKKTQATGDRFKEGVKINQGLLALGNVISALGSSQGQGQGFVRYRDSKLTRLLQDSLGGNSITLMIACVSPADYNVAETLSTLRYADRARKIKNKPVINQDPHIAEINHLKGVIQKLRVELLAAGGSVAGLSDDLKLGGAAKSPAAYETQLLNNNKAYLQLQEKYLALQKQFEATLHDLAENEMRAHIVEASHEKLKEQTDKVKLIVDDLASKFHDDCSAEQMNGFVAAVKEIQSLVGGLDEEFVRTANEITVHKRQYVNESATGSAGDDDEEAGADGETSLEVHSMMQERTDAYTSKQIDINEQLRRINHDLGVKEELQLRLAGNLTQFHTLEDDMAEKFRECEEKIRELEAEKALLADKLSHVKDNASAKLAEERRKRLQVLEQEISSMKRKNLQQDKMLKIREKETQRLKNLSAEIQTMKEAKVRLIRTMRQESENFRQWKLTREKELMQLKNKDRKMQNEMARKEALHTKQRNVLKRKCEEAIAINKRLKDALDRQKVVQSQRHKNPAQQSTAANKVDQILTWVGHELEVIMPLIDAEQSLEQLMDDRGIISKRIAELKELQQADACQPEQLDELASLQEELEMRNAHITDLQQKVCVADLATRISSLCEGIQGLAEARAVVKLLLKAISDKRREYADRLLEQRASVDETVAGSEAAEKRCEAMARRLRQMEVEHEHALAARENMYAEKVGVLLRELHSQAAQADALTPEQQERLRIQEEQLDQLEKLRNELAYYKEKYDKRKVASPKAAKPGKLKVEVVEESLSDDMEPIEEEDDSEDDPDWTRTPLVRKRSKLSYTNKASNSDVSSVSNNALNETYVAGANDSAAGGKDVTAPVAARESAGTSGPGSDKRKSKGCSCSSNCRNKRCGCRANAQKCSLKCRCVGCQNDKETGGDGGGGDDAGENNSDAATDATSPTETEDKENVFKSPERPMKRKDIPTQKYADLDATSLTPKVARGSILTFETKTNKKKLLE